jgi:hypothetical protein
MRVIIDNAKAEADSVSDSVASLTEREAAALASAGSWYASYHARMIADRADDESAYAVARRERYDDLISALRKLGVRLPHPGIDGEHSEAA